MTAGVLKSARIAEVALVALVMLLVVSIAIPSLLVRRQAARRSEAKQNLHTIQLSVERFAVDTEGSYPQYLIGGSAGYRDTSAPPGRANEAPVTLCQQKHLSDPLLRKGYITQYPRNPFARDGLLVHATQEHLPTSITGNDPLRNGSPEGKLMGTRFGPDCNLMGSVLCDPRFEKWTHQDKASGKFERLDTWAIIEYPYWDAWTGKKPEPFLPGEFFYKGMGTLVFPEGYSGGAGSAPTYNEHLSLTGERIPFWAATAPADVHLYMLGLYGATRDKGYDVLGRESPLRFHQVIGQPSHDVYFQIPIWTRSQYSVSRMEGSPYLPANDCDTNEQVEYGCRNGILDGLVLVLAAD